MSRTLLIIGACLGIFLSGAITGGFVALRNLDKFTHRRAADNFTQQNLRRVADQLSLSEEQRQKIRPIMIRAGKELQDTRRRAATVLDRLEADIRAELTPEQRAKFEKIRMRLRNPERPFHRPGRDARPGEGPMNLRPLERDTSGSGVAGEQPKAP